MAWPSGTKASTSNVDQGSDKIRLARPDIKQNIDNTNAIIDTFTNMGSASDKDLLIYNGTSFSPNNSFGTGTAVLSLDADLSNGVTNEDYNSGFTVTGGTHLGITTGAVDSAGKSTFHLPAGTYNLTHNPVFSGVYGSGSVIAPPSLTFVDSDPDSAGDNGILFTWSGKSTGFYFRVYDNHKLLTLTKNTDICMYYTYAGNSSFNHPAILINRLA